jgi:uncharacterized protein (TIGR02246 family)
MRDQAEDNAKVIDALVDAYNRRDARGFSNLFADDAWHGNLHSPSPQQGREEIYRRYVETFAAYPENRTEVVHRAAYGHFVVDHERVQRSKTSQPFDVVAIYTLEAGRIKRLELVRE